jgi:hypothetical protein
MDPLYSMAHHLDAHGALYVKSDHWVLFKAKNCFTQGHCRENTIEPIGWNAACQLNLCSLGIALKSRSSGMPLAEGLAWKFCFKKNNSGDKMRSLCINEYQGAANGHGN